MITRISEIGVAVRDIGKSGKMLVDIFGAKSGEIFTSKEYNMKAEMFRVGNVEFELMEPMGDKGLISDFIRRQGEGLHHIAFQVDDIVKTIREMKSRGFRVIYEDPVVVDRFKATFLHPSSFGGVLFELIEDTELPLESEPQVPALGIGVERILGIGILVEDLETAGRTYSEAFSAETSETLILNKGELKARICHVGNVDLVLIEMPQCKSDSNRWLVGDKPGLYHIVMKVAVLDQAIEFLEKTGIDFVNKSEHLLGYSDSLFLELSELGGIPVVFKEKSIAMVPTFS